MENKRFNEAFTRLNVQQKQAVKAIEGPVLVLAGPGTGKTQVLTLRIAEILNSTQMNPYNILCLTFTQAAANEMRERLNKLIGVSAYDVTITTFHGFTNSIIQDFSFKFGSTTDEEGSEIGFQNLQPLDDLGRLQIISRLLTQGNWQFIKPFKQPLYYLKEIAKSIGDIKRERISPPQLVKYCQDKIGELEEENKKSDKSLLSKLQRTRELVTLFLQYQKELVKNDLYDFEDMINWVIDKFEADPELALIYQEKYQYILVDEFQDTNSSQLALIKNLTSFYKSKANIFVVGDPNQSIYRFQGASTANIESFKDQYPQAQIIDLIENYRSGQSILDLASGLIGNNYSQPVTKLNSNNQNQGKTIVTSYHNRDQESQSIANMIKKLLRDKVPAKEIAILVRKNYQIDNFARALDELKIPYQTTKYTKIIRNAYIDRLISLLNTINRPFDKDNFKKTCFLFKNKIGLIDAFNFSKMGPQETFKKESKESSLKPIETETEKFFSLIQEISQMSTTYPAIWVLSEVVNRFEIFKEIDNHSDRLILLNALKDLYDSAKDHKDLLLNDWLNHLQELKQYDLDITHTDILYGENEAVTISTLHQAKGLEYQHVFIPQMEDSTWLTKRAQYFVLPQFVGSSVITNEDEIAEARRLFYVGLTRAKTNLYISFAHFHEDQSIISSRFLQELNPEIILQKNEDKPEEEIIKNTKLAILPLSKSVFTNKEEAWLKDIVQNKPLSPTAFCTFLHCPRNFFLRNILRLPMVKSESLAYGTAIHSALEDYFQEYKKSFHKPDISIMLVSFKKALDNEVLSDIQRAQLLTQGNILLKNYFEKLGNEFTLPVQTEYNFSNHAKLGNIPLTGKIDKIEWVDQKAKTVRVIDYKTGRVKSRNALLGNTKSSNRDYITQLKFYSLLGELDPRFSQKWKVTESAIQFLDEDYHFTQEIFQFSQNEINELKEEIKDVWQKIQNLEFDHNVLATDCEYCEMITI
jgi:DNA helicase-2/ATP-dependent DNA helicase PcrA